MSKETKEEELISKEEILHILYVYGWDEDISKLVRSYYRLEKRLKKYELQASK